MAKRKKNSPDRNPLTTALLVKAILDIIIALLDLLDRYIE